ncbi:hydroxysteroid (20-beta) dehydrogenase 2 isoform X2 [Sander lucioperca]|uniref:hydroxysteroid (20-beta) dehydrogenase 2 isoform X2 n=1 Tax=Sander lucioperca TaxID=283035 RepID=UPI0016534462|nr:hydroxysteroid (20-beta) dehydrogenase 2 isoform X2 [Sander lucioperca]
MSFTEVLAIFGGFTVVFHLLKLAWKCWCGFRQFVWSELWHVDLRTYGQWAVVTGATSGIGKAYASELARRGLDVVLVSRSDDKLQIIAKEIDQYGRKTRTIQVDFTDGQSIYPAIAEELQGLEIGILVNNVGMAYSDHFAYFLEIPDAEQKITQVVNCNMLSVPQMTRLVLPGMVERGTGLIINISSEAGVRPQPLLSLYSATKIFVTYFSQCLHAEYKSKGIIVQCVAPFMVSTNMTKNVSVNCFVKSSSTFASEALNTVGHSSYTSGCLSHALQATALAILLPDWFRMSPFFIRKLRNVAEDSKYDIRVCNEKKLGEKEE